MGAYAPTFRRLTAAEFTRPSNTTAYTAGDVVGPVTTPAVQSFANAVSYSKGAGRILNARLSKSDTSVTNGTFRLYFYNAAPTAIADNSAWTTLYADREKLIGYVDLAAMVTGGTSGAVGEFASTQVPFPYTLVTGTLYCVIVALGAYTPASAETFSLSLTVEKL